MTGSSRKNLHMFRKLCGTENMANVSLVTTMWDTVTPEVGAARERELYKPGGFWASMIASGASFNRYDGTAENAQELVLSMVENDPTMIKLQQEIASGKALIETDAGASINEEILRVQRKHKEDLENVKREMEFAMKQG